MIPVSVANVLLQKTMKVFLNLLNSNTTNIFKNKFIFLKEKIQKNNTCLWKSVDTAKASSNIEKKKIY